MKRFELTPAQKNIYELQSFYSGTSISVICGAVIFREKLEMERLICAVKLIVGRHEALRLRFCISDGRPLQYIGGDCEVSFKEFPSKNEMRKYCEAQARIPFETDGGQMFRMTVFDLPDRSGIILSACHLIADAWTYSILAADVYDVYERLGSGENIGGNVCGFTEFIGKYREYISSEKYRADRDFFAKKYSGNIEESPIRISRSANINAASGRYTDSISAELSAEINGFCKENGIFTASLFESAVLIYLSRINKDNKTVTVGLPVLGRSGIREKAAAGMFVSTLPFTLQIDHEERVISFCKRAAEAKREVFRHRNFPYGDILRDIREKSDFSGRLFDVMVSCQNAKTGIPAETEWFSNGFLEIPLSVSFDNRDSAEGYTLTFDYQTDFFRFKDEIKLLSERIKHILSQIVHNSEIKLKDVGIIPKKEYRSLISFDTISEYPKERSIHEAFSEAAARFSDKTALVFENREYTYSELDKMSDVIACFLCEKGVLKGDIVPIISRRSPYMTAAMLGVLKAGGAYMPVSPDFPDERKEYIIRDVKAKAVLTCGTEYNGGKRLEELDYSRCPEAHSEKVSPDDVCYVIFTSGSSGRPKGVAVTHKNVMNYCSCSEFNVAWKIIGEETKSIVSVTDFVFDIFVTESILPLLRGITVYLANDEEAVSQSGLAKLVSDNGIDVIQTTPTKMRSFMLDKKNCGYLSKFKAIMLGGEELPETLFYELKKYTNAEIYNVYGPAETTVWSTLSSADKYDTIGKPVSNTRIYILDDDRKLLPVGIMGEIYISGDGVGNGYINNPELKAEKFLPDPFYDKDAMYRTGDLGIMRPDGNIEFWGRRDHQIKLRGLRIELGEIESVMGGFDGVGLAAVVCRSDESGRKYLAGFYTGNSEIDERALRSYISEKLPSYMIPNVFVRLGKMPMTASGKISRKELPAVFVPERKFTVPENEKERMLCGIMAKVLGLPSVGTDEDFFLLGGDSFSAMEFAAIAGDSGFFFSPRKLYECRTVKSLCAEISETKDRKTVVNKYSNYPMKRKKRDIKLFKMFSEFTEKTYKFEVSGLEKLDFSEKYIFCPNHESDLDCMWVWTALSGYVDLNDTCALIAREHLDKPLSRLVFRIEGGIPIARKGDFMPSLKRAAEVLKNEKRYMLIHPEGTRTRSGELGKFKKGAAMIAVKTAVKLVPVYIGGAGKIYPVGRAFPKIKKYPLCVVFGTPISPLGKTPERLTEEIRRQVSEMKGKNL